MAGGTKSGARFTHYTRLSCKIFIVAAMFFVAISVIDSCLLSYLRYFDNSPKSKLSLKPGFVTHACCRQ